MNSNESEKYVEVVLGFALGTLAIAFWLFAVRQRLQFRSP